MARYAVREKERATPVGTHRKPRTPSRPAALTVSAVTAAAASVALLPTSGQAETGSGDDVRCQTEAAEEQNSNRDPQDANRTACGQDPSSSAGPSPSQGRSEPPGSGVQQAPVPGPDRDGASTRCPDEPGRLAEKKQCLDRELRLLTGQLAQLDRTRAVLLDQRRRIEVELGKARESLDGAQAGDPARHPGTRQETADQAPKRAKHAKPIRPAKPAPSHAAAPHAPAAATDTATDTATKSGAKARPETGQRTHNLPVQGFSLSAGFGQSGQRWARRHTGQDFAVPTGTPVRAVADGTVVHAGWHNSYGWNVRVRHKDGTESWYAHLSKFKVRSGPVKAGDVIAYSGSTGNSTGPHLHLEVRVGGTPVNPMSWLRGRGLRL
jgi:murein DD-endopeptidase MepM/ murein hydrolase activator NlpD